MTHRSNVSLLPRATITYFRSYSNKKPRKKPRNGWNQQTDKPYLPYHQQWALKNQISAVYPPFASLRFRSSQNVISTLGNNSLDEGKKARRELISERGCVARIIRRYNMVVRTKGRETEREGWGGWNVFRDLQTGRGDAGRWFRGWILGLRGWDVTGMRRNRVVALTVRPTYDSTAPHTLFLSVLLSLSVTEPRSTSASSRHIGSGQFREELSNWPKIPGENNERHKGRSWRRERCVFDRSWISDFGGCSGKIRGSVKEAFKI